MICDEAYGLALASAPSCQEEHRLSIRQEDGSSYAYDEPTTFRETLYFDDWREHVTQSVSLEMVPSFTRTENPLVTELEDERNALEAELGAIQGETQLYRVILVVVVVVLVAVGYLAARGRRGRSKSR